ncbi:MAG: CaiB/BaiF CoA transferase family protein [Paracoccaceae bacterium]
MSGPLVGLKIIEMLGLGPAPLAGQLLADLGAEVTIIDRKFDNVDHTDIHRRNKKSVALNLKTKLGHAAAKILINKADILIEGFRPGVMEKLQLGPEEFKKSNPRLIFARMTGWGQDGPFSNTAGHDINYLAITGALHAIGPKNGPPIPPLNLAADYGGGSMFLIFGILAALYERERSGLGQVVDVAMVDGVAAMMSVFHTSFARGNFVEKRASNMLDGGAPYYRCYTTLDEKALSIGPIEPKFFAEFVKLAELPEHLLKEQNIKEFWEDQQTLLEDVFKTKTLSEWSQIFNNSDACAMPIIPLSEVPLNKHNKARNAYIKINEVVQPAPAPRFDRTPAGYPKAPVGSGGSNKEILSEIGFSDRDIDIIFSEIN